MIFAHWRARRASKAVIEQILGEIVAASRRPALYESLGAPDRIDGRFELLALHAGLVLRRLSGSGGPEREAKESRARRDSAESERALADAIAQDLVDGVFAHFDDTLREMGHSDIAVAKRLKAMGRAFYGRNTAYGAALDEGSLARLAEALRRNVYGAADKEAGRQAEALARHVASLDAALGAIPIEAFAAGRFRFPPGLVAAGDLT
ncbi:MAG TPA: ubiquinol-cytochrome C chaperone family protein [Roseiarcus sp.]|nr:ubiquinol-cytochrome C chaperone family protein [Roseiarcus sp.]